MFYENFKRLCTERGTTPTAVAKAMGISTSMTANWKKGGMPRGDTLQKLADYFSVNVDYLLGGTTSPASEAFAAAAANVQKVTESLEKEKEPTVTVDPKLLSLIDSMNEAELADLERYAEFILSKKNNQRAD